MRRFEFRDGKSAKFWTIALAGRSFTVSYGKIGSAGQTQTKEFKDEAKAKSEHDKLVAEKLAKGYVETTPKAAAPAAAAPPQQAAATPATPAPAPAAAASAERTFVCGTEQSLKFWNIALQGQRFTVRFGKVGTAGQTQTKDFKDEAKAQKEHDKLIAEKLAKGYVETTRTARPADPLRDALEAAIDANPDDLAAYSALADYLQEHGDPRGEFIVVQLALEDPKRSAAQRKKFQQREQQLLRAHEREWVGAALPSALVAAMDWRPLVGLRSGRRVHFRRGLPWGLSWDFGEDLRRVLDILAGAPEVGWVRDLQIEHEPEDGKGIGVLAPAAFTPVLRRLGIGEYESRTHTSGAGVARLVAACVRLQELVVYAHLSADEAAGLFAAPMPALRTLAVCCTYHYPLDRLAKNKTLTQLRTIRFFPHMLERGDAAYLNAAGLRALGASKHLTALAELTFNMWSGADAAADALVQTGLLFRLERLDLTYGNLTDAGAQTLGRALASRPHRLRFLDLDYNAVTPAGLDAFGAAAGVEVVCGGSHAPDSDEYLAMEGDVE
jgi:uncharacterized protein (TIGR02996 family)